MVQPVHHTEADGRGHALWPLLPPGSSKSGHLPREGGPGLGWVVEGKGAVGRPSETAMDTPGDSSSQVPPTQCCQVLAFPIHCPLGTGTRLTKGYVCVCVCVCVCLCVCVGLCSFYKALSIVHGLKWVVSHESSLYFDWNPAFQIVCGLGSQ